ncbi:MAG TPA: TIR domain-containing protein [Longimicrobium sp.]
MLRARPLPYIGQGVVDVLDEGRGECPRGGPPAARRHSRTPVLPLPALPTELPAHLPAAHPTAGHRYAAFISYRHVEPDAGWARWLHRAIEEYRVPAQLVARGAPPRLGSVFRDEEELAASHSLSTSIEAALEQSRWLIVVCSPRAPGSRWVNEEVLRFRQLGRGDRILALLIEGEPEAAFPPALRDASPEPLAADARPGAGESLRRARADARLRLLAPLLECRYDDLRQREGERQRRRLVRLAMLLAGLLVLVAGLAAAALVQGRRAERGERNARAQALAAQAQLEAQATETAREIGTTGYQRAVLLALESLALEPTTQGDEALRRAVALLAGRPQPLRLADGGEVAAVAPGGAWLAGTRDSLLLLWRTGDTVPAAAVPVRDGEAGTVYVDAPRAVFSPDGRLLATLANDSIHLRRVPSLASVASVARPRELRAMQFAPGSRLLLVADRVSVWDYARGAVGPLRPGVGGMVMAVSEDAGWIALRDTGRSVRVQSMAGGRGVRLGASDERPRMDLLRGGAREAMEDYPQEPLGVALSRDGARVALSADTVVEVWDRASRRRIAELPHEWRIAAMHFSRDGRYLATVTGGVSIDAADPDATRLVGSTIRVWDVEHRRELGRISLAEENVIDSSAFSTGGDWLLTTTGADAVWTWNLWPDALRREACARLRRNLSAPEARLYLGRDDPPRTCPGLPIPDSDGSYDGAYEEGG